MRTWAQFADRRVLPRRNREGVQSWLFEPKTAVWVVLGGVAVVGGVKRLFQAYKARRAVNRLEDPQVTAEEIEAAADHGREAVWELLRLFSSEAEEPKRQAAGRALARLWQDDQLVSEEEQAVVRRGFTVNWHARRRYPHTLQAPLPIIAHYHVPFLRDDGRSIGPSDLLWSHRLTGARRAALEVFSPWRSGPGQLEVEIIPADFEANTPHRLILETRVRVDRPRNQWEIALPQVAFSFEFAATPTLDSILTLPDAARAERMGSAIWLEPRRTQEPENQQASAQSVAVHPLLLGADFALLEPPRIAVSTPLPCDLAHTIALEIEGATRPVAAGRLVLSGQGDLHSTAASIARFELGPVTSVPAGLLDRPGRRRARVLLEANASLAWADPKIRSVWPGRLESNWIDVEIVRV